MYSRGPNERESIRIPNNYSGNAFRSTYTDMSPPAEEAEEELPQKHDDENILPVVCEEPTHTHVPPNKGSSHNGTSIFSSLVPSLSASSNFPFGHGIGSEELFILGIMLLIYMSGDEGNPIDSELLLLLCILLFSG